MSSNEKDAFDTLMEQFVPNEEASPAEDTSENTEDVEDTGANAEDEADASDETPEEAPTEEEDDSDESEDEDESESDDSAEETSEEKPRKKNKKTASERIAEVVAQKRATERELAAEKAELAAARAEKEEILRRLEKLEAGKSQNPASVPAGKDYGLTEPTVEDLDDSGELKYPLGTFDPSYVRDLTRYDRAVERAYEKEVAEKEAKARAEQAQAETLFTEWNKKLDEAEKTSPDIRKKAQGLVDAFSDAPAQHIQTIAQTIMQLDNGPKVLEYLSDNLDEADNLVKLGTPRALIQLGRIDGLFVDSEEEPAAVKKTAAPKPPTVLNRGVNGKKDTAKTLYDKMLSEFR